MQEEAGVTRVGNLPRVATAALVASLSLAAAPAGNPAQKFEVQFTIDEAAIMDYLRAATPVTITVGRSPLRVDLILSDPRNLVLREGRADVSLRIRGRSFPFDDRISASVSISYDKNLRKYFAVMEELPLTVPGLGQLDLSDAIPRVGIPSLVEDIWRFADRPVGLNLTIRRLAILDHAIAVAGDVSFVPVSRRRGASRTGG